MGYMLFEGIAANRVDKSDEPKLDTAWRTAFIGVLELQMLNGAHKHMMISQLLHKNIIECDRGRKALREYEAFARGIGDYYLSNRYPVRRPFFMSQQTYPSVADLAAFADTSAFIYDAAFSWCFVVFEGQVGGTCFIRTKNAKQSDTPLKSDG